MDTVLEEEEAEAVGLLEDQEGSAAAIQPSTGNKATVSLVRTAAKVKGLNNFHNLSITLLWFLLLLDESAA